MKLVAWLLFQWNACAAFWMTKESFSAKSHITKNSPSLRLSLSTLRNCDCSFAIKWCDLRLVRRSQSNCVNSSISAVSVCNALLSVCCHDWYSTLSISEELSQMTFCCVVICCYWMVFVFCQLFNIYCFKHVLHQQVHNFAVSSLKILTNLFQY